MHQKHSIDELAMDRQFSQQGPQPLPADAEKKLALVERKLRALENQMKDRPKRSSEEVGAQSKVAELELKLHALEKQMNESHLQQQAQAAQRVLTLDQSAPQQTPVAGKDRCYSARSAALLVIPLLLP